MYEAKGPINLFCTWYSEQESFCFLKDITEDIEGAMVVQLCQRLPGQTGIQWKHVVTRWRCIQSPVFLILGLWISKVVFLDCDLMCLEQVEPYYCCYWSETCDVKRATGEKVQYLYLSTVPNKNLVLNPGLNNLQQGLNKVIHVFLTQRCSWCSRLEISS